MLTPYAGILCPVHGPVDLTRDQYLDQMMRPDDLWRCPKCGLVSEFDDDRYEQLHPEEDD